MIQPLVAQQGRNGRRDRGHGRMGLTHDSRIHVMCTHRFFASVLASCLKTDPILSPLICDADCDHLVVPRCPNQPHIFILDHVSFETSLFLVSRLLRASYPGSMVIVLTSPHLCAGRETLRLERSGIDGLLHLNRDWHRDFPLDVRRTFEKHKDSEESRELSTEPRHNYRNGSHLTSRERQILPFVLRQCSDKTISEVLSISQRTAKFHVSNLLLKVGANNRRGLQRMLRRLVDQAPA